MESRRTSNCAQLCGREEFADMSRTFDRSVSDIEGNRCHLPIRTQIR